MVGKVPACDYFYDPDNWEVTWESGMADDGAEDSMGYGEVKRFCRLVEAPDVFAAYVPIEGDGYELRWFESEAEAREAIAAT